MKPTQVKYLIIGAGPTGLGAAQRLLEMGMDDVRIIEQEQHAGGLASSFVDKAGFTWDIGGHVQFSHYAYFDEVMDNIFPADEWLRHNRSAWAWMFGRYVPYPVQHFLHHFPEQTANACLEGLAATSANDNAGAQAANFAQWLLQTFGKGLFESFMRPYNEKVWAHPAEQMSYQWIAERVALPDLNDIKKRMKEGLEAPAWGPNSQFRFPLHGGTGNIWQSIANRLSPQTIAYGQRVVGIDAVNQRLTCRNGDVYSYEYLITTVPLDLFCAMLEAPEKKALSGRAKGLCHSSTHVVGLGLRGVCPEALQHKSWIYFPEDNCPFYRTTVFSNYSPNHVPADGEPYWSLMTETSESAYRPVDHVRIIDQTIAGCLATGLIESETQICSRWHFTAPYGYPVPSLERDAILREVIPALERYNIFSRGRFGGWKYEVSNQDHSFMQGVEIADRLHLGLQESTYTAN